MPGQIKSYTLCKRSETALRFLRALTRSFRHASSARLTLFTSVLPSRPDASAARLCHFTSIRSGILLTLCPGGLNIAKGLIMLGYLGNGVDALISDRLQSESCLMMLN
jgi:hypothetical protein